MMFRMGPATATGLYVVARGLDNMDSRSSNRGPGEKMYNDISAAQPQFLALSRPAHFW